MGIFNIHPKGMSSITCEILGDQATYSTDYILEINSLDLNESGRMQVIYGSTIRGGVVRTAMMSLVPVKFRVLVFGTTQANSMANATTLTRAIMNSSGGHIEYRPSGLGSSIMTTWYHYLRSQPPKLVFSAVGMDSKVMAGKFGGLSGREDEFVTLLEFSEVMTKAIPTSDPETAQALTISDSTLQNRDDTSNDNHFRFVQANNIGIGTIPILTVYLSDGTSGKYVDGLYVHIQRRAVGDTTNYDWFEGESAVVIGDGSSSTPSDSSVSNGQYLRLTGGTAFEVTTIIGTSVNESYIGKVTPVICMKVGASTEVKVRPISYISDELVVYGDWIDGITGTSWTIIPFSEVAFPPAGPPDWYTDSSVMEGQSGGDLQSWMFFVNVGFEIERVAGSGAIDIDFYVWPKADGDCWFGLLETDGTGIWDSPITPSTIVLDCISGISYQTGGIVLLQTEDYWDVLGGSLKDVLLWNGNDWKFRIIGVNNDIIDHSVDFAVALYGYYCSIFPFNTT